MQLDGDHVSTSRHHRAVHLQPQNASRPEISQIPSKRAALARLSVCVSPAPACAGRTATQMQQIASAGVPAVERQQAADFARYGRPHGVGGAAQLRGRSHLIGPGMVGCWHSATEETELPRTNFVEPRTRWLSSEKEISDSRRRIMAPHRSTWLRRRYGFKHQPSFRTLGPATRPQQSKNHVAQGWGPTWQALSAAADSEVSYWSCLVAKAKPPAASAQLLMHRLMAMRIHEGRMLE